MALTPLPFFGLFPPNWFTATPGGSALSAAGQRQATILRVPKAGTIDRVTFYVNSASNNQPIRVSLQTRDATTGQPTGTLYGGSAAQTFTVTAGAWNTVTLATPATGTAGDYICVVVEWDSTTGNITFQQASSAASFAELATYSAGAWARATNTFFTHPIYNDGSYFETGALPSRNASTNYTLASTPDEVGVYFKVPASMRFFGAQTSATLSAAVADVVLYDDTNTVISILRQYATNPNLNFETRPTLDPTRYYRLTWRPVSGTVSQIRAVFPSLDAKAEFFGLFDASLTTRTDLGAWTNTALEIPFLLPLFDAIDVGSGGGGIMRVGWNGGFSG